MVKNMLSDELTKIKSKYFEISPCSSCKYPENKKCLKCGACGRKFDNGLLVKEVYDEHQYTPNNYCKHNEAICKKCGDCGRRFENGILRKEVIC